MNWSEELKKDISLYRFSELILLEVDRNQKNPIADSNSLLDEKLTVFYKALLGYSNIKVNS